MCFCWTHLGWGHHPHQQCHHCQVQSANLRKCSNCKEVWYCSKSCQTANWANHKPHCHEACGTVTSMSEPDFTYMVQQRPDDSSQLLCCFWKDICKHGLPKLVAQEKLAIMHLNSDEIDEKWKKQSLAELCCLLCSQAVDFQVGFLGSIWQIMPLGGQQCSVGLLSQSESRKFRATGGPWVITIERIEDH